MRHCRSGIAAAALPPAFIAALPPALVYSGIAASMHSQRHCRKAALPPACIHTAALPPVYAACTHSGIAASMHSHSGIAASICSVHSQRHCRQHAFTQRHCRQYAAALPPCSVHSQRHSRQHAFTVAFPHAPQFFISNSHWTGGCLYSVVYLVALCQEHGLPAAHQPRDCVCSVLGDSLCRASSNCFEWADSGCEDLHCENRWAV